MHCTNMGCYCHYELFEEMYRRQIEEATLRAEMDVVLGGANTGGKVQETSTIHSGEVK